jgi:hypothetical protein
MWDVVSITRAPKLEKPQADGHELDLCERVRFEHSIANGERVGAVCRIAL